MDRKFKILSETNSFVVNKTVVNMVKKFQELNIKMERTPSSSTFEQFALRLNSSDTIDLTQELLLKIQKVIILQRRNHACQVTLESHPLTESQLTSLFCPGEPA